MKREELSILIEISRSILDDPRQIIVHPVSQELIEFRIISYPQYGKLEVMLKEVTKESFYTVTVDLKLVDE